MFFQVDRRCMEVILFAMLYARQCESDHFSDICIRLGDNGRLRH